MLLGAHMSIAGGVSKAIDRAQSIGCTALQLFTANARGWKSKPIPADEIARFRQKTKEFGQDAILAHDSYLINLASPAPDILGKSINAFKEEVDRCDALGIRYLVMHPGSALKQTREEGLLRVAKSFNEIFKGNSKSKVNVLIETTAGQGTNLGTSFEEIRFIMDHVRQKRRFGVCVDTAHVFAAGYDIATKKGWKKTFEDFDRIIGLEHLKAFHVNDSKGELGSHLDRHDHIGKGKIGLDAFSFLVNDPRFANIPMSMETPKGDDLLEDVRNMKILFSLVKKGRKKA